jgi:hypothetical protein
LKDSIHITALKSFEMQAASTQVATTGTPQSRDFKEVHDALFEVTRQEANVSQDVTKRQLKRLEARSGSIGTYAAPLNRSGSSTLFTYDDTSNQKMRFGTSCLVISLRIYGADEGTACNAKFYSVPWNLLQTLMMGITFKINNSAKPIFRQVDGEYEASFRARLFRFFSREAVENMGNVLFTPVFSLPITVDGAYGEHDAPYCVVTNEAGAAATDGWSEASVMGTRAARWIGANSHLRTITKSIPLSVLMGLPDSIVSNVSKFELKVDWLPNSTGDWTLTGVTVTPGLLEQSTIKTGDAPARVAGVRVAVTECHMMLDLYDLHGSKQAQLAADKTAGIIDRISFIDTEVKNLIYEPGSQLQLTSIENMDAIMIMQRNVVYNPAGPGGTVYTNGVAIGAVTELAYWSSPGQTTFGGNSTSTTALTMPRTADEWIDSAHGQVAPFRSIFIRYGDVLYPESALSICPSASADYSESYEAYLNACARAGKRDSSAAVPYDAYRSAYPFVMLRPFADGAPRPSGRRQDLIVNLTGGVRGNVTIIVFKLVSYRIMPDGGLVEVQF